MLNSVFKHLKNKGYDTYFPTQHIGKCTTPYIVVKYGGQTNNNSHSNGVVDIMVYIPINRYSTIENFKKNLVLTLSELNYLRKTGLETPPIYEENIEAHSFSIQYLLMKERITYGI